LPEKADISKEKTLKVWILRCKKIHLF